jgi:hypothetical protein
VAEAIALPKPSPAATILLVSGNILHLRAMLGTMQSPPALTYDVVDTLEEVVSAGKERPRAVLLDGIGDADFVGTIQGLHARCPDSLIVAITPTPVTAEDEYNRLRDAGAAAVVPMAWQDAIKGHARDLRRVLDHWGGRTLTLEGGTHFDLDGAWYFGRRKKVRVALQEVGLINAWIEALRDIDGVWIREQALREHWDPEARPPGPHGLPAVVDRLRQRMHDADWVPGEPDPPTLLEGHRGHGYRFLSCDPLPPPAVVIRGA